MLTTYIAIKPLKSFAGMLQILRFNWPWYAAGLLIAAGSILLAALDPSSLLLGAVVLGTCGAVGWMFISLLISHWVYDRSPLRSWDWISSRVGRPRRAANIHAGFDQTSSHLLRLFPQIDLAIWDIFQSGQMTEGSIARARSSRTGAPPARAASLDHLPAADESLDAIFLLFAAHEIRSKGARERFFAELHRILTPGGTILLVEHLRDVPNFLAYGPGFFHFLPLKEWFRLCRQGGFSIRSRYKITPFVNVLQLQKGSP